MRFYLLIFIFFCCFACNQQAKQQSEFLEVRVTRQTALEGGETLILRKINKEWSAELLGDGYRFSCLYKKSVRPKSGWEEFWKNLKDKGFLEISDGRRLSSWEDGNEYLVEINNQHNWKRYSFRNPDNLKTKESEQIKNIGDLISLEFETPMFKGDYSRAIIGDYLIEQCKNYTGQDKVNQHSQ